MRPVAGLPISAVFGAFVPMMRFGICDDNWQRVPSCDFIAQAKMVEIKMDTGREKILMGTIFLCPPV